MPYARKRRRGRSTRGRVAKRRRYNQVASRRRLHGLKSGGLSAKKIVKMRYVHQGVLQSISGTVATYVFRCNSIFDPDFTGVGHQPLGRDEWAVLYENYKVRSARITIQAANTASVPVIVSCNRTDSTTGSTGSMSAICEQPNVKWVQLAPVEGGKAEKTISMGFVASKMWPALRNDDTLRAGMGSNPAEGGYFVIQMQSTDAGQTANIPFLATINYIVELTTPKILTQS